MTVEKIPELYLVHPLDLDDEHWSALHRIAKRLSIEHTCDYDKALIWAYLEISELAMALIKSDDEQKH